LTVSLQDKVYTDSGNPVSGATATAILTDGTTTYNTYTATSNAQGLWSFSSLPNPAAGQWYDVKIANGQQVHWRYGNIQALINNLYIAASFSPTAGTTWDFTQATLKVPNAALLAPTAAGTLAVSTSSGALSYGDGVANHIVDTLDQSQTITGAKTFSAAASFGSTASVTGLLNGSSISLTGNLTASGTGSFGSTLTTHGISDSTSITSTGTVQGSQLTSTSLVQLPQNNKVQWTDANSAIQSNSRVTYFDEWGGGWTWRNSAAGLATAMSLSAGGNLSVPGTLTATGAGSIGGGLTVTGNMTASSVVQGATVQSTGNVTAQNSASNVCPFTVGGVYEHIEHGSVTLNSIGNGSSQNMAQTFTRAFNSAPIIIVGMNTPSSGDINNWHCAAQGASPTGFNVRVNNGSGSTGNCSVYWFAMGN
jgi:hypothetical protein